MKKKGIKLFSLLISTMVFICNISFVKAEETSAYAYSDSATSNGVTLKVEWNEPVLGEPTTFHVSAMGGSGIYRFNMEAPSYTNPDELAYESVADPSRGEWTKYTAECESQDYTFTMMATGTYNFRFHVMDMKAGVTYLRTNTYIQVSSPDYPSVNSIVQNAVAKCNSETNGSDYSKALWLHDWLLEQLDYDNSLKWSSAESALTRSSGTCQAYERAYAKLLSAAGIENAETRDTYDGHTWNAMKLDGKWYQVDCTWDDSSENYYNFNRTHLYFALSDELMAIAHQGHNKLYTVEGYATPSNSLEHNYFVQNGDAQQWVEFYRNRIQENLNNKSTEFSIQADNSTYPPSIYGIQNGIIAYVMNQNEWFVNGKKVELAAKTNDKQFDFTVTYPVECTNHDWDEGVITTEPTCTTKGVKTFTCKNCKTTKTEEVNALGHDYSKDWTIDKEATCLEEGIKSHQCTRCDEKTDVTVIPVLSHNFDNGVITTKAACTKSGVKTYTCKDCKTTKTEVIKALGHDYSKEWTIDKDATCTESGSKSHHCTRCDSKSDVTVIPKTAHNYDDGVITTEPTCTKSGVKTYTCKDCKTTKTEELKALGHDYSKEWTIDKDATCTESGSKSHHCTRCDSKSDVTIIPKLSHDWILTSTVNPTRDHEGKKIYTCSLCKETKEEVIGKLVGKWVSNSVGKWYEYSDGTYENSGFKKIENETYYFTSNGYVKTGWLSINNDWYFFKESGCMVTSNWVGSYYMDSEGKMKTNSFTPDGYYCGADGVYVRNAWIKYNGNYYYMNANGLMRKNAWAGAYYLGADGVMKTNSFTPDGYYVGSDGAYYRNRWIKYEGKYYYTNGAGLIVKNTWIGAYYLGSDGVMMSNSFTPDGYYVGADGAYLRNQKITVDGKEYYLNSAGKVAKNQWVGEYYLNGAGSVVKNQWVGNYWCGSDGKYVRSSWVDNNRYYVDSNGVYVPGRWVAYGSRWCYYAGSVYAKDITLNINGTAYTFDSNGYMK